MQNFVFINTTTYLLLPKLYFINLPVKKIDGVAPVVFDVPAEGGETHAHVEPGYLHA